MNTNGVAEISKRMGKILGTASTEPYFNIMRVASELKEVNELLVDGELFSSKKVENELGDLLFTVLQTIIHSGKDPATLLQNTIGKLDNRLDKVRFIIIPTDSGIDPKPTQEDARTFYNNYKAKEKK